MRVRSLAVTLSLFMLLAAFACIAQDSGSGTDNFAGAWVLYEQGKALLDDPEGPELGEALLLFHEAIDKRGGIFPEAEMAIGDVYFRERAYALAARQYRKAYDLRSGMEIAEQRYTVLYRLADLYEIQEMYKDMEDYLLLVTEQQPYYTEARYEGFRNAFETTFREKGLDHLFKLYRMEGVEFSISSHSRLGWFYYRMGRFQKAILNCLFALDIMITGGMNELRRVDPGYVFTSVEDFLYAARKRENVRQYLIEGQFFKTLYYLAASAYAASFPARAEPIWRLLADFPLEDFGPGLSVYADRSERQLESPWTEPLINSSARRTN